MIKKIEMRPKGTGDYADILYPKTSGDQVIMSDSSTLEAKLATIKGKSSTLIVAASNSSAAGKASADYVCAGTNDHTTINSAITALGVNGGKVVLLEGLFAIAASILLTNNVTIEGQGNGTLLQVPNANNTSFGVFQNADATNGNSGLTIANLRVDGNKANNTANNQAGVILTKVSGSYVQNVTASNCRAQGISLSGSTGNRIAGNTCQSNTQSGISLSASSDNTVMNNVSMLNGSVGIFGFSVSNNNTITGNIFKSNVQVGISITSGKGNTISGNTVMGNGSSGISLSGASPLCDNNTITGNTCIGNLNGITLSSASNCAIAGNTCQGNLQYGISMSGTASNNTISANTCVENNQANGAYDNITIIASASNNNIQGNTCRQGALTNKPRYGIRVDVAGCTGNMITNNDLTTGGATGAFSDLGTGTVTTAGNKLA